MDELLHGAPLTPRVKAVIPTDGCKLLLTFTNDERRVFDASPLFKYAVFSPLRNPEFFKRVTVSRGSIAWPQDIDYCPDTLYMESKPLEEVGIADPLGEPPAAE